MKPDLNYSEIFSEDVGTDEGLYERFFFLLFFFQHSLSRLLPLSDTIFGFKLVVHCSSESYVENFAFLKHLCWIKYLIFSQDRDNSCLDLSLIHI